MVSLRKVLRRSAVRCSLLDLASRWEITRKPRPAMTCCWMLVLPSTSSQMNCISTEQRLESFPTTAVPAVSATRGVTDWLTD